MKVLILAAGYGTRLYPLIKDTPKALLDINGRPLLDYVLDRLEVIRDLREVIVVTNDKFYKNFKQWAKGKDSFFCPIRIVSDQTKTPEDRLGSIGDINYVLNQGDVGEDLLVIGSDNLFDFNIAEYIQFAQKTAPLISIGVYDIGPDADATQFGVVTLEEDGKLGSFEEKPQQPKSSLVAMCFYYFPKNSLGLVGQYLLESNKSDKAGDYICWLHLKDYVYGFPFTGKWYDIGSVEAYREAQKKFS